MMLKTKGILVVVSCTLASCGIMAPKNSLERVAKDWSMTVRASQVMPVYPLDEDLRPGDVFISKNDIASEIETWESKGFLPLINRYDRIAIAQAEYDNLYANGFAITDAASFHRAPNTAFPSYTFSVDKRGALGLAIPLNSVPVALSVAGAQSATGSVVFKGASNQGLTDKAMNRLIGKWATDNKSDLGTLAKGNPGPTILRVISRVYSIKGATVSLTFADTSGTDVRAGAEVNAPELLSASEESYKALITQLNKQIELKKGAVVPDTPAVPAAGEAESSDPDIAALQADIATLNKLRTQQQLGNIRRQMANLESEQKYGGYVLPGASFKLASRTARGVTMDETFPKPLAIGYLAREYLILPSGAIQEVGSVEELIENPALYKSMRQRATELSRRVPVTPPSDSGAQASPFPKK